VSQIEIDAGNGAERAPLPRHLQSNNNGPGLAVGWPRAYWRV
jgi:hypothetical protein